MKYSIKKEKRETFDWIHERKPEESVGLIKELEGKESLGLQNWEEIQRRLA